MEFQSKVEFFPVGLKVEILKRQRILKSPDTNNTRKLKGQEGDGEEMMISESWNCCGHRAVQEREILWNILPTARDSMLMQEQMLYNLFPVTLDSFGNCLLLVDSLEKPGGEESLVMQSLAQSGEG